MLLKGTGSFPPSTGTKDPNLPPCANGADAQSRGKGTHRWDTVCVGVWLSSLATFLCVSLCCCSSLIQQH